MPWTAADIPDQSGRIALITGANSGLGLESARALAARGATVVLACRSLTKAEQARQELLTSAHATEARWTCCTSIWPTWPVWLRRRQPWRSATAAWIC
jgi:NAD(P)-dependent dehydrogenase (short-subunit alcohol dehydrogenase family)